MDLRQLQGINPHPRFATLTGNIRRRRGGKVGIRVPLFRDARTPEFQQEQARETKEKAFGKLDTQIKIRPYETIVSGSF